jgi:3-hydroxyacyl-CoA dehydrogenase
LNPAEADAVIEAVFGNLALNREIFATLDPVMRPGTRLATNTCRPAARAGRPCAGLRR